MTKPIFSEEHLPIKELEQIGLAQEGQLLFSRKELDTLLAGRRTNMIRLKNISSGDFHIPELDAKISIRMNAKNRLELLLHPIYRRAEHPDFLTGLEAEELQKGQVSNIWKMLKDKRGVNDILVEYDPETREFIITDTEAILVPDMVNSQYLSTEQKERYRQGKEVQIADGTIFQYSGSDSQGLKSNRLALVASVLIDGGLTYMAYSGLNLLFGKKADPKERNRESPGYKQALEDMKQHSEMQASLKRLGKNDEYSRGYSRSGTSR